MNHTSQTNNENISTDPDLLNEKSIKHAFMRLGMDPHWTAAHVP